MTGLHPSPACRRYHVAWMSAINEEYSIATTMLDEAYGVPEDLAEEDERGYTFGRIGGHNVVMASLPKGRVGVEEAQACAMDMRRSFKNLRFGLMVGIAGGAPSDTNDIRLGDIVVSVPNDKKRSGGVFHYGFGASVQEKGFEYRGCLDAPPEVLLNAVGQLERNYAQRGHQIDDIVQMLVAEKTPHLNQYQRPTQSTDILFRSTFIHPEEGLACNKLCHFVEEEIVKRPPRSPLSRTAIHHGIIGSASNLMRDATLRDMMAKEDGVLCFEMESAGLMNKKLGAGWLVIRGICDYSDTHKNDDWQHHAAAVAAVYAKQLLSVVRPRIEQDSRTNTGLGSSKHG